jgi:hypothetical protein
MTALKDKIILTDCDGVLLDWEFSFNLWMDGKGYTLNQDAWQNYHIHDRFNIDVDHAKSLVRQFNDSAEMLNLTPLQSAVKYIKKLHEEFGYVFHVITSQTDNEAAQKLRIMNLENVFGKHVFIKHTIIGCGEDKTRSLDPYMDSGCFWLEDKPKNADVGRSLGLQSLLVAHHYNSEDELVLKGTLRLDWDGIYKHISENTYK